MDEHDEFGPAEEAEAPAAPITERVRIVGAEPAGAIASDALPPPPAGTALGNDPVTVRREERYLGFQHEPEPPPPPPVEQQHLAEPAPVAPELPHWTDPPTGQVPAVLDRRGDDEVEEGLWSGAADTGPSWREHEHEWDDSGFEPSMLADDETRVGALEETPLEERRPWEFDDLSTVRTPERTTAWHDTPSVSAGDGTWDVEAPDAPPLYDTPTVTEAFPVDAPRPDPLADDADSAHGPSIASPTSPRSRRAGRARRPVPTEPTPRGGSRNVTAATVSGVGVAVVALACFKIGTVASLVLVTVVAVLAAAECYAALRRSGMRPATLLGLVATVALMVSAYTKGVAALPLVLVMVLVTAMIWYLVGAERGSPVEGISATVLAFVWVGLLGSFAALLLAPSVYPQRHGIAFLLGAIVATVAEDVGALAIGSWLGRHQLAPHVSPNKTWEGAIGGAVLAVVASAAITGQMHPWTPAKAAVLGLVVAVVAPIGDLCESLVKRDLGLKDMGSLLPGHGGVLDRIDALLFVLPATYYLVRVLNLG
ncbi:MAG: phosphatidate cytidylyltransferase [Acidimicrobiales bacterium]